jgi:hypothetical protein
LCQEKISVGRLGNDLKVQVLISNDLLKNRKSTPMKNPYRKFFLLLFVLGVLGSHPTFAKPKEVKLNAAQKRKLNTFFSNFSEAYVAPFQRGKLSDATLISFGIWHRYLNDRDRWCSRAPGENYTLRVRASAVQSAAQWYFGKSITRHRSVSMASYKSGFYYLAWGEGDPLPFAQVTKLLDNGDGTFTAYTNEYSTHDADPQAAPSEWKKAGAQVWNEGHRRARIEYVGSGARARYILIEYQKA